MQTLCCNLQLPLTVSFSTVYTIQHWEKQHHLPYHSIHTPYSIACHQQKGFLTTLSIDCSILCDDNMVLLFWCLLTQVVLDKIQEGRKTVVCVCVCTCACVCVCLDNCNGW